MRSKTLTQAQKRWTTTEKDSRKDEKGSNGEINENLYWPKKIWSYRKGLPLTRKKKKNAYKKQKEDKKMLHLTDNEK